MHLTAQESDALMRMVQTLREEGAKLSMATEGKSKLALAFASIAHLLLVLFN